MFVYLQGQYIAKNVSFGGDELFIMFSGSTEKWWEYHWKIKAQLFGETLNKKGKLLLMIEIQNYFLQFRNRNPKNKKII